VDNTSEKVLKAFWAGGSFGLRRRSNVLNFDQTCDAPGQNSGPSFETDVASD
jgi:hypothetical protein